MEFNKVHVTEQRKNDATWYGIKIVFADRKRTLRDETTQLAVM